MSNEAGLHATSADAEKWHATDAEAVLKAFAAGRSGLDSAEADRRLAVYGPNALTSTHGQPAWKVLAAQFRNVLIVILLVAAVLSGFLGSIVEAIAIVVIVLLAIFLGFVQEYRAERAIDALREMAAPTALVRRDNREQHISSRELVPGDVVVLQTGQRIAADARLLEQHGLETDESPLTGESASVRKSTDVSVAADAPVGDRLTMVYAGSTITRGRGVAVVVATGATTEFGRIAGLLQTISTSRTPLQKSLDRIGRGLAIAAGVIVALIISVGLVRGEPFVDMFVFGIALAVAAVPEALPAVVTISLALGVQRMVRRNALVRHLPSVETLGSTSVICADKTGTLTRDQMTVRQISLGETAVEVSGEGWEPAGEFTWPDRVQPQQAWLEELLGVAALCSDASVFLEDGDWTVSGDPTEAALVVAALKAGLDPAALAAASPRTDEVPFDAERKYMLTRHAGDAGELVCCKGAPEVLLDMCTTVRTNSASVPLDGAQRQRITRDAQAMAARALRVLAIARQSGPTAQPGLELLGLVGMMDPPRRATPAAIKRCRAAGIRPVMITGDHPDTAAAIAREIGLGGGGATMTGAQLDRLSQHELQRRVEEFDVYARVSPEHKMRVIEAWQQRGAVVAMTGDGVNDAPALKKADIGVAMGIGGTDVAREAAAMTLLDDNFDTIVGAIEEGRAIFNNISKYLMYLLSSNIGEIGLMAAATLAGLPLPLTAVQILYVNLATDGLPALALAVDPHDDSLMQRRPRDPRAGVFTRRATTLMLAGGAWSMLINVGLFAGLLASGRERNEAMAMTFVSLVLIQFFKAYSFRTMDTPITHRPFANRWLNLAIGWELLLLTAIVYVPLLQAPFGTYALGAGDWMLVALLSLSVVPVLELVKRATRRHAQVCGTASRKNPPSISA